MIGCVMRYEVFCVFCVCVFVGCGFNVFGWFDYDVLCGVSWCVLFVFCSFICLCVFKVCLRFVRGLLCDVAWFGLCRLRCVHVVVMCLNDCV